MVNCAVEHLCGLSEDMLEVGRLDAGCVTVKNARCDVRRLVSDCADMVRPRADAKNLELILEELPDSPRFVLSDPGKLRQIIINLLANAVEHTDHGRITLRASSRRLARLPHLSLIFEVRDTGIGIAAHDQVRIFDPFTQVGKPRGLAGTGLGLSISRQLVQVMGGTIRVQSTPGEGSLFVVSFPVQAPEESAAEAITDEDNLPCAEPFRSFGELTREALAALPTHLRDELLDAVVRLDTGSIANAIGRVSQQDVELGTALMRHADRYEYTQIFSAVTNANSRCDRREHAAEAVEGSGRASRNRCAHDLKLTANRSCSLT
jgi:hypothetical protein